MKKLHIFIIALLLSIFNTFAQKVSLSDAVNAAGRQRMLGQRMAKNKVYLSKNKNSKNAKKELEKTILTFHNGLKILKDFAPTDVIKHHVQIQEYAFKLYKEKILDDSKEALEEVIETNTLFLAICDDVVTELIKYSKFKSSENKNLNEKYVLTKIAEATGASGKLRYLTQRLTLYFALNRLEVKDVTPMAIHTIINTMDRNLNYLTILEFNTLEIDDALSEVQFHWAELKDAIYDSNGQVNLNTQKIDVVELYNLCNKVLGKANTATKMYADLNKS